MIFYYHPNTGDNVGIEYRLGDYSAFKIIKDIVYEADWEAENHIPKVEKIGFRVEVCQDPRFWEKIFFSEGQIFQCKII